MGAHTAEAMALRVPPFRTRLREASCLLGLPIATMRTVMLYRDDFVFV
jgi:hypothetical protein